MAKPYSSLKRSIGNLFTQCLDVIDAELEQEGRRLYGDRWPAVLAHNTPRITKGAQRPLTYSEKASLAKALKTVKVGE